MEATSHKLRRGFFRFTAEPGLRDIAFQSETLAKLLGNLAQDLRLPHLHKSLDWLSSGGMEPASVRAVELQVCERLGLPVSDPTDRLPHIFVNYVKLGAGGIKLGFMRRRGADETIRAQAEQLRTRLSIRGVVCGPVVEPKPDESFFWFAVEECSAPPTVRELLESFDDVIVR
jgi:hypothetical protein